MMRAHLWLAGLATLATISTADAAQDVEVVANSILRTYSDYCDPLFFEQNRSADARVDATLAHSYSRAMLMRYDGQCDRFFNAEVAAATVVPNLLHRVVELQRSLPRTLSELQIELLGSIRRYDDMATNECSGQPQDTSDISHIRAVAELWLAALGRDDALEFAKGYVGAEAFARLAIGLPAGGSIPTPCSAREVVASTIELAAVNSGLTAPRSSEGDAPSPAFPEPTNEQADPDGNGYGEDGPDGGDVAIDPSQHSSAADLAALARFAGHWGTTLACDQPGDQITIDAGDAPRIGGADLGCDLGGIQSFGDTVTFDATCGGEADTWSGQGAIQQIGPAAIDLFLFGNDEPRHLVRCGIDAEAQTSPGGSTGDLPLEWDGSWVRSETGGSEIEIPSFLQRGPMRALMNADEDYGTAYDGADGLSLSLRQYRVDTQSSAHQWLREGAASDVIETTYEVDKGDLGVISGYLDSTRSQAYYGICRRGAGDLQCVDMFWNSRDQEAVEPIINRVVRSFRQ